ncbi:MAG: DUF362 domain-containing protein [Candidatus Brocadiia bacterium]
MKHDNYKENQDGRDWCPLPDDLMSRLPPWVCSPWLFPVVGVLALFWFLIRVIPKPTRARYPCQRVAMPVAFGFLGWIGGMLASVTSFRRMKGFLRKGRYVLAVFCVVGVAVGAWFAIDQIAPERFLWADTVEHFVPSDKPNDPMGRGRGINPGRVVWVRDMGATRWDGKTGHWWDAESINQNVVDKMVSMGLRRLTGKKEDSTAWEALFRHFNRSKKGNDAGYRKGEKIAIKVNFNNSGYRWKGNGLNTSPQMILALLRQLIEKAGIPEDEITVYDASRLIGDPVWKLCHGAFPGVRFVDREGKKGRIKARPDRSVAVHYADTSLPDSGKTFLPKCVTGARYLINLALLKGHSLAGVTFNAKNHFGSVWREADKDKWNAGWSPGHMHETVSVHQYRDFPPRELGTYTPLVELMGHAHLGGKTLLFFIEGLYGAPHQSCEPEEWESEPFNGNWPASILVSQDHVAIESVGLDFCRSEPTLKKYVRGAVDNYLHEAAEAKKPPSGSQYDPEGDETGLGSLGVHEHWNDVQRKQYSRDLGRDHGIELMRVENKE